MANLGDDAAVGLDSSVRPGKNDPAARPGDASHEGGAVHEAGSPNGAIADAGKGHAGDDAAEGGLEAGPASLQEGGSPDAANARDAGTLDASSQDAGPCIARDEVCNGVDDDCDEEVDEGLRSSFSLDNDGDGFGAGTPVAACAPPSAKYTTQTGDCNDACVKCFPGAPEALCDGKDNDCDGTIDEGLKKTFYVDADGDGFGSTRTSVSACSPPAGYVSDKTDCNDSCASCNPGLASDATCDGKDDDCSGSIDEDATYKTYYKDCDEDKYAASTTGSISRCAAPAASGGCGWATTKPASISSIDCNDANSSVHPGQTKDFTSPISGAAASVNFDYDCDGKEELGYLPLCTKLVGAGCSPPVYCFYDDNPEPGCGEQYPLLVFKLLSEGCGFAPSTPSTRGCK